MEELAESFKSKIRLAFAADSSERVKAEIRQDVPQTSDGKKELEGSTTSGTEVAHFPEDQIAANDDKAADGGNYRPFDNPTANDNKTADGGNFIPFHHPIDNADGGDYWRTLITGSIRGRSSASRRSITHVHHPIDNADGGDYWRTPITDGIRGRSSSRRSVTHVPPVVRSRRFRRGCPRHGDAEGYNLPEPVVRGHLSSRRFHRGVPRVDPPDYRVGQCSFGRVHGSEPCHCCRANYEHLEKLKRENRYGDFKFNDFDGAGVDVFKTSSLAPQLLPYKVVTGNRVEYFATPNHRPLEGFVADFLKPENQKPVELTEEQRAALEPDEYWDV